MRTMAVDFDGPIHRYGKGWHDGTIYDELTPGAREAIAGFQARGYAVFVFTSREIEQVVPWMQARGFDVAADGPPYPTFWDSPDQILVTNRKLAAVAYIDDRAVRFDAWPATLSTLNAMHMRGEL